MEQKPFATMSDDELQRFLGPRFEDLITGRAVYSNSEAAAAELRRRDIATAASRDTTGR
jgi:hypothetical protein